MKKLIIFLSVITVLFLPASAMADEKIVLAVLDDFPPFQWVDNKQVTGIDADLIREVCKRTGIELEYQPMPWKRALKSAENGAVTGIAAALHNEERAKFLYYTRESVHIQKNVIMIQKGSNIRITGYQDLEDKIVGVVRGFSYGPEFDSLEGLGKTVCNDQQHLVQMLANKRIDVAMGSEKPLMFNARQLGLQDYIEVGYVVTEYPAYTVFSKAAGEKGKSLAERFDTALRQIKEEGLDQKIIEKYFK